jgi:hypothetical protein
MEHALSESLTSLSDEHEYEEEKCERKWKEERAFPQTLTGRCLIWCGWLEPPAESLHGALAKLEKTYEEKRAYCWLQASAEERKRMCLLQTSDELKEHPLTKMGAGRAFTKELREEMEKVANRDKICIRERRRNCVYNFVLHHRSIYVHTDAGYVEALSASRDMVGKVARGSACRVS